MQITIPAQQAAAQRATMAAHLSLSKKEQCWSWPGIPSTIYQKKKKKTNKDEMTKNYKIKIKNTERGSGVAVLGRVESHARWMFRTKLSEKEIRVILLVI
jgi:hypothetical protein